MNPHLTPKLIAEYMASPEASGFNRSIQAGDYLRRTNHPVTQTPEAKAMPNYRTPPEVSRLATDLYNASNVVFGVRRVLYDAIHPRVKALYVEAAIQSWTLNAQKREDARKADHKYENLDDRLGEVDEEDEAEDEEFGTKGDAHAHMAECFGEQCHGCAPGYEDHEATMEGRRLQPPKPRQTEFESDVWIDDERIEQDLEEMETPTPQVTPVRYYYGTQPKGGGPVDIEWENSYASHSQALSATFPDRFRHRWRDYPKVIDGTNVVLVQVVEIRPATKDEQPTRKVK